MLSTLYIGNQSFSGLKTDIAMIFCVFVSDSLSFA